MSATGHSPCASRPRHTLARLALCLLWIVATPSLLRANAGVFGGFGYDVELIKSDDIEMLSEDITITPGRGPQLFDGSGGGMNRVDYTCIFKFKNLRTTPVSVQVGFPLDSGFLDRSAPSLLERPMQAYRFIAHDGLKSFSLRYETADKNKKFRHLFIWDMDFAAGEEKSLYVSYQMPLSMAVSSTDKEQGAPDKNIPEWQASLSGCLIEWFGYVTQTGTSWANGRIGKAKFTLNLSAYERIIRDRPIMEGNKGVHNRLPVAHPTIVRTLQPALDVWQSDNKGNLVRVIENYRPDQDIHVRYHYLFLPRDADDTHRLVASLRTTKGAHPRDSFGGEPQTAAADFDALRDILRELNGQSTDNAVIQPFVGRQLWRGVPVMTPTPEVVFDTINQLKSAAEAASAH